MKIIIALIILIIFLIGLNYLYRENFDVSSIFKGVLAGSLLYLCWPCLSTCCAVIVFLIAYKLLK